MRRPQTLRAWRKAYAAATSTTASYGAILDASSAGQSNKPAKTTTIAHRAILERRWLLDPVPAWTGTRSRAASLGQAPKRHLADPARAARLLGVGAGALLDTPNPDGPPAPRDPTRRPGREPRHPVRANMRRSPSPDLMYTPVETPLDVTCTAF